MLLQGIKPVSITRVGKSVMLAELYDVRVLKRNNMSSVTYDMKFKGWLRGPTLPGLSLKMYVKMWFSSFKLFF